MHGNKYDYCPECQEAELELLNDVHLRHMMRDAKEGLPEKPDGRKRPQIDRNGK